MSTRDPSRRALSCVAAAALSALGCSKATESATTAANDAGAQAGAGSGAGGQATGSGGTSSAGGTATAGATNGGAGGGAAGAGGSGVGGGGSPGAGGTPGNGGAPPTGTPYVYVSGNGANITEFKFDIQTAQLTKDGTTPGGASPSYLAVAPDEKHLYAINEGGGGNSKIVAFSIDPQSGHLAQIDMQDTGGMGAPHLAVDPSGNWIAVAHYGSGHTSIVPVAADGTLSATTDVKKGPGDTCVKAHQAVWDKSGTHLFVPCLGSNYVIHYVFSNGALTYGAPDTVAVTGGPRHMAFDPSEKYAYVLSELESVLTSFIYDKATGTLSSPQTIPSFDQTKGSSAHIVVHPGGKWLYASNRTENSIGLFSIDASGRPHPVKFEKDGIHTPRDFSVDPSGAFLIAANQDGDQSALVYRIAATDGTLTRTQIAPVGGNPTFTTTVLLP